VLLLVFFFSVFVLEILYDKSKEIRRYSSDKELEKTRGTQSVLSNLYYVSHIRIRFRHNEYQEKQEYLTFSLI